jgi:aldehyde oxidoreductase
MITLNVNGAAHTVRVVPIKRLADVLRDDLRLIGTKVGCNAGDCGACTVLIDGAQACACVTTVEGLANDPLGAQIQAAFHAHGAAQCGICTPGMLMASVDLLRRNRTPSKMEIEDALGGVLCRCTGYQKITEAVAAVARHVASPPPAIGAHVGARMPKVDGIAKLNGTERYGADGIPGDALWLRVLRSPHHHARFNFGDLDAYARLHGLRRIFTAQDVPSNGFGIYPTIKDQPVFAVSETKFKGEAVCALVGAREIVEHIDLQSVPITWEPLAPLFGIEAARTAAQAIHIDKPDNILLDGGVRKGDASGPQGAVQASGTFSSTFVEHAYIEPEAGWARRIRDRIAVHVSTQTPYMDRDEVAVVLKIKPDAVRIVPTACGGGFGGKLDMSVQPYVAVAAWHLPGEAVACVYTRPESMASTTKRHPSSIAITMQADAQGKLLRCVSHAEFDTGAYASWGPTVATRVPIHATGPYAVPHVDTRGTAYFTHCHPSGAFRGFGVPQAAIAHEAMMDGLADQLALDRLEFRHRNAIRAGDATATGQVLHHSAGLAECLDALRPRWQAWHAQVARFNSPSAVHMHPQLRRGVGIGCMWYGIGNTSLSNPSTMRIAADSTGITLYSGAVDIGQGSNTILLQIAADALGVPASAIQLVTGDTDLTLDAGKTSASRQTFVSGKAVELAAQDLRQKLLTRLCGQQPTQATLRIETAPRYASIFCKTPGAIAELRLHPGEVIEGIGRFDPPTAPQDANGQGVPYACYAFAAQIAMVEVDLELGMTRVLKIAAAHDVGKAINPTQVEGQIHGGILQGLGFALMEEYVPGKTENLHDYLIPSIGDVPEMEVMLIEDPEPLGPSGAKGVGEPGLIPTAPAILGAIENATGVRPTHVPVLPHRLKALIDTARRAPAL